MATIFPRWKAILVGVCCFVLSCVLLLTVSSITSSTGLYQGQDHQEFRRLVLNPVVLPPRRLAQRDVSEAANESRYGYTPLAAPTETVAPTGINNVSS